MSRPPDPGGRTRWGRAGERLTTSGARDQSQVRALQRAAARRRADLAVATREAYRRWRAGLLVPDSITRALNLGDLHGPEVDLACNAEEPEVDQWEAGERYPRWDQLVALARLTGFRVDWCTTAREPLSPWATSMWFHMPAAERRYLERTWNPIMRFPRAVIEAAALDQTSPDPPEDRST